MGKFFYLARRTSACADDRPVCPPRAWRPKRMMVASLGLVIVVAALYLMQANRLATKGFQLETLRQEVKALRTQNRELEGQALQKQSLRSLSQRITDLHLVPASDIDYVAEGPSAVSRR